MVRGFLLEQWLTDRRIAQVIKPIIQVLLDDAARLLLSGKGIKLRYFAVPLRWLPRHAVAVSHAQFVHHQVQRPLVDHHMMEQQRKQLLTGCRITQEGGAQRQFGSQVKAVIPRPGQQLAGVTGRCVIGEREPAVVQQLSDRHHLLIHLSLTLDKQRAQYAVARHHVDKRLTQHRFVHRIKEADGKGQVEDLVVTKRLVNFPQGMLRQRQRRLDGFALLLRGEFLRDR